MRKTISMVAMAFGCYMVHIYLIAYNFNGIIKQEFNSLLELINLREFKKFFDYFILEEEKVCLRLSKQFE